jgi:hypothetical protein
MTVNSDYSSYIRSKERETTKTLNVKRYPRAIITKANPFQGAFLAPRCTHDGILPHSDLPSSAWPEAGQEGVRNHHMWVGVAGAQRRSAGCSNPYLRHHCCCHSSLRRYCVCLALLSTEEQAVRFAGWRSRAARW